MKNLMIGLVLSGLAIGAAGCTSGTERTKQGAVAGAVLGAAADFLLNTEILRTVFDVKLWILIPAVNFVGQALKDYIKHA